jgi:hypothetical protein
LVAMRDVEMGAEVPHDWAPTAAGTYAMKAQCNGKTGKLIGVYALKGEWELLVITEFPDEKWASALC